MSCYREGIAKSLEFTAAIGAGVLYVPTGCAGSVPWDRAAGGFLFQSLKIYRFALAPFVPASCARNDKS